MGINVQWHFKCKQIDQKEWSHNYREQFRVRTKHQHTHTHIFKIILYPMSDDTTGKSFLIFCNVPYFSSCLMSQNDITIYVLFLFYIFIIYHWYILCRSLLSSFAETCPLFSVHLETLSSISVQFSLNENNEFNFLNQIIQFSLKQF